MFLFRRAALLAAVMILVSACADESSPLTAPHTVSTGSSQSDPVPTYHAQRPGTMIELPDSALYGR